MDPAVTVREVMTREYVGVTESDPVDGAVELLLKEGAEVVLVQRGERLCGVLTPADALAVDGEATVAEAMREAPRPVAPGESVVEAVGRMADLAAACLPVVGEDGIEGVVTRGDVVGAAATYGARPEGVAGSEPVTATAAMAAADAGDGGAAEDGYSAQSVCEACGSLASDLREFNGQLVCADCREV